MARYALETPPLIDDFPIKPPSFPLQSAFLLVISCYININLITRIQPPTKTELIHTLSHVKPHEKSHMSNELSIFPLNNVLLVKIEGPGAGIPIPSIIIETCC